MLHDSSLTSEWLPRLLILNEYSRGRREVLRVSPGLAMSQLFVWLI